MSNLPSLCIGRYKPYALTLLCTALIGCTNQLALSVQKQPEQARSADSFVDSIGVAVHLRYKHTPYANYSGIIKPRLQELGIRHIRDGGKDSTFYQKLNDLATIGIKSTLVMDPRDGTTPRDAVTIAKAVPKSIEAVEGPNETDLKQFKFSYKGQIFPQGTRAYQNELYAAIKGDSATASLPVLMPSMGWGKNAITLGYLSSGNMGNMHSYPANGQPPTADLDSWYIPYAKVIAGPSKPLVVTEVGYHNAINNPQSASAISELASSKYLPRLNLEYFNRGIKRVFLYELINQGPGRDQEENFGLLRHDGSPKPAFIAIKNLILLLKDPGTSFPLKSLNYSLSGDTTNVRHTLLQKRDGTFYLILWQGVPSFSPQKKTDISVLAQQVTLTLNTVISKAAVYQPIKSITPTRQFTSPSGGLKQLKLSVPDHPLVIKLVPART